MNILIPHNWLLEHLETKVEPKEIQRTLSLCGPSVERIYQKEGDSVYDIEVTTNRVDSMSIRGIAREAAVILRQFDYKAKLKKPTTYNLQPASPAGRLTTNKLPLPKIYNNPEQNKRTVCVILSDVKRTPTPEWMAKRLRQIDMNVHDAVIDITNYVTHELGHPCHAFDYDKLMNTGGEIHIVEAEAGEKFSTLDGESFTTVGGEVVFKNGEGKIIDLPSIKGTANTSIDQSSKNVLLLIESIKAEKVRFASMTHAIRTTAAQLMEKNVDPNIAMDNLLFGIKLYQDLCQANVASEIYDDFSGKEKIQKINLKKDKIEKYLGLKVVSSEADSGEISLKQIVDILEQLECKVDTDKNNSQLLTGNFTLVITPPSFRPDLKIPADLIEEIARIYGYHNLDSKIMSGSIPLKKQDGVNFTLENKIKHFLANIGWQEVYTYSMVSEKLAEDSGFPLSGHLKIQNPLTDDRVYLRRSLLPSLEEFLQNNPTRRNLSVFEIANVYHTHSDDSSPAGESLHLVMVSNDSYRLLKGSFEALCKHLFIENLYFYTIKKAPNIILKQEAMIAIKRENEINNIGKIGQTRNGYFALVVPIQELIKHYKNNPKYQTIPKTSAIIEDLTFTFVGKTEIGKVIDKIKSLSKLLQSIELKEIYKQNHTFTIEYLDPNENLSAVDIAPIRKKIVETVKTEFKGELVGQI